MNTRDTKTIDYFLRDSEKNFSEVINIHNRGVKMNKKSRKTCKIWNKILMQNSSIKKKLKTRKSSEIWNGFFETFRKKESKKG